MESSDMLRFCTILADNINTGSNLAEKLESEAENLREMRRKELRKKIHMVDSRMMVPMMIMLFSLILITVAPAMLSFN
jgi:pilus assembly protein TadC